MPTVGIRLTKEEYREYCNLRHELRLPEQQHIAKRATLREMRRLRRKLEKDNGQHPNNNSPASASRGRGNKAVRR